MSRVFLAALLLLICFPLMVRAQTPIWLEWDRVTNTNIVASPSLGSNDVEEKDFVVGDFDQDGDADLICVRKLPFTTFGNRANVLFMNVDGVMTDMTSDFAPELSDPDNARDVMTGDFDGDGWIDLVVANAGNQSSNGQQPRIFMNLGENGAGNWLGFAEEAGRLPFLSSPSGSEPNACAIGVGDVTGNGVDDLYLVDYLNDLEDKLLINDGTGNFTEETTSRLPSGFWTSAFATAGMIRDVNGDGLPDIIKNSTPSLTIAYNAGNGFFNVSQSVNVSSCYHFDLGDLNQDGRDDIFVVQDPQDQFKLNQSSPGTIPVNWSGHTLAQSPLTTGFGGNVHIADLDGDGDNDVVVTDVDTDVPNCNRRLAFLRNNGATPTPTISDPYPSGQWTEAHHTGTFDVAIADFNSDGALDIWVGHCNGNDLYFQVVPNPPLSPPESLACGQVVLDVELTWVNPDTYDSIEVRRDGAAIATVGGSVTSYTDVAPVAGNHSYTLVASFGAETSTPVSCTVQVTTVLPVLSLACDQIDEDVLLSWTNQAGIGGADYQQIAIERNGQSIATLPGTATGYADLAAPIGPASYAVVAAIGGDTSEPALCVVNVLPTNIGDLVVGFTDDDTGTTDSATAIANALIDNGFFALAVEVGDLSELATQGIDPNDFQRLWLELGTFPHNHVLSVSEGALLADFVTDGVGGGDLYLGGGNVCFAPATPIDPLTGIDLCIDGDAVLPAPTVQGLASPACALINFTQTVAHAGESTLVDHFETLGSGEAVLQTNVATSFTSGAINLVGDNAVITQSIEMGGIGDNHDKKQLVQRYLFCFPSGLGVPVADFVADPLVGSAPLGVQFTSLASGAIDNHSWLFGDGQASVAENPFHVYTDPGTYTVAYAVSGPGGQDSLVRPNYITVLGGPVEPGFVRADANEDSAIDLADAISILNYLFSGNIPGSCLSALDSNDDGALDLADAIYLLNYLFTTGAEPPAPFPACGVDPTADAIDCGAPPCP